MSRLAVLALGLALTCDWLEASSVEVDLRGLGRVRGLQNPQSRVFRGIPYAQPPLAENRWNAPIPVAAWAPRVLDASQFGPACFQDGLDFDPVIANWSEDCLTLNVFAPIDGANGSRPVLVYLHGGSYNNGGSNESRLNGQFLAEEHLLVVVTLNYR